MRKFCLYMFLFLICILVLSVPVYTAEKEYKSYTDIGFIEESDLTIKQVVDHPDKFHRDIITVDGEITEIEYKKIFTGRKFTLFKLADSNDNEIKVYARGYIKDIDKGTKVRINGRYSKEKSFLFKTYPNVMKARKVYILKS